MTRSREIGPIGTFSRAGAGLVAITLPVALSGLRWRDLIAIAGLAAVATVAAQIISRTYGRFAPAALARRGALCGGPGCALMAVVLVAASAAGALTSADGSVVLWGFLGASMLLAAARGDAGCEVLAVPNAITGRNDQIGCIIFTPIDKAEAHRRAHRHPATQMPTPTYLQDSAERPSGGTPDVGNRSDSSGTISRFAGR